MTISIRARLGIQLKFQQWGLVSGHVQGSLPQGQPVEASGDCADPWRCRERSRNLPCSHYHKSPTDGFWGLSVAARLGCVQRGVWREMSRQDRSDLASVDNPSLGVSSPGEYQIFSTRNSGAAWNVTSFQGGRIL